jgi:hypothetical protein
MTEQPLDQTFGWVFFFFLIFGRCLYSVTFDALYLEYYGINLFFSIKIENTMISKSYPF